MRWFDWLPFGRVPGIAPGELEARLRGAEPPVVLDVRSAAEVAQGTIPGARHLPVHELPRRLAELDLAPGGEIVAVCESAHRSIPAVRLLREKGFRAVQLEGGMAAWRRAGLPVERPARGGAGDR